MTLKRTAIAAIFAISLFSCATKTQNTSKESSLNPVYVTNKIKVYPLSPDAIEKDIDCYQMFSGHFSFRKREMDFAAPLCLLAEKDGIFIMMLSDFGVDAGSIRYDGKKIVVESNFFPTKMKFEYIILDLQNAYYKADALKAHYEKAGLLFSEEIEGADTKIRTISDKKKIIEQITLSPDCIHIKNFLRNYEYTLSTIDY